MQQPSTPPLTGVTVLDLSHIYNGPYATFLMAMGGARVIKIEPPEGEHLRHRADLGGAALPFAMLNSNKQSLALDLKKPEGRELFLQMAKKADVVVENFAPGVTERLGLGADVLQQLNPRLIYASSSGYGRSGPYRDYPAMDLTVQAMSGVMSITGFPDRPPVKAGPAVCDFFAGIHLYGGIVTALYEREKTGLGRIVEVSMQEAVYASLSSNLAMVHSKGGKVPPRTGNRHGGLAEAPYNVYPASDGYVAIICNNNRHFHALLKAMGQEALATDPRFQNLKTRIAHIDEIDAIVESWTKTLPRARLVELMLEHRVPHAPVRDLVEVMNDPNMHARGSLQWVEHPKYGRVALPKSPMQFAGSERLDLVPSAELGADRDAVLGGLLGLEAAQIAALKGKGVV